jgi:hypothetical protein
MKTMRNRLNLKSAFTYKKHAGSLKKQTSFELNEIIKRYIKNY